MLTRSKLRLTYFLAAFVPLLLLAVFNYWNGLHSTNAVLRSDLQRSIGDLTIAVGNVLQDQENHTMAVALSSPLQRFATSIETLPPANETNASATKAKFAGDNNRVTDDLKSNCEAFLSRYPYFDSLTLFDNQKHPVLFAQTDPRPSSLPHIVIQTNNFPTALPKPDQRVWEYQQTTLLTSPVSTDEDGSTLLYTVPLTSESGRMSAVLVVQLDVEQIFRDAARMVETTVDNESAPNSILIVLDDSGTIIYHSNRILERHPIRSVMPELTSIASEMIAGKSDSGEFQLPSGQNYLLEFAPLPQLNVALAIARDRSTLLYAAHLRGVIGLLLAPLFAFAAAWLLDRHFQKKSRGIEQVTEGLTAIAKGQLNRIELRSTDDARAIADNINVVTERLRAQIAREAESRQLESFVKLSAMLTHDLKNAIETLSLIVGNMERHFDNEQFRADALKSLSGATDKLKMLVARLSKPVNTLSGDHKKPTASDLVPILNRVVMLSAQPLREKHKLEIHLPATMFALVDSERIERVVENLVLNALEAMADKSGVLTVSGETTSDGQVAFSISDTGMGINKSFVDNRLFHPFATTKKNGVGLGLYTCREIVQANGGFISVESVPGAGTTFRVVLPSPTKEQRN